MSKGLSSFLMAVALRELRDLERDLDFDLDFCLRFVGSFWSRKLEVDGL